MKNWNTLLISSLLFSTLLSANTLIYEDAEDQSTARWNIYTNASNTATIDNVYDVSKQSNVIKLTGANTSDGFKIGSWEFDNDDKWNNTTGKKLNFDFKYMGKATIYLRIETNNGAKYLYYKFDGPDEVTSNGRYIRHNLGVAPAIGTWVHIERNIESDTAAYNTGNVLTATHGFFVNGSASIDNLTLDETQPTSEWRTYNGEKANSTVTSVHDQELNQSVISLNNIETSSSNGFELGAVEGNNTWANPNTNISWKMKYNENFVIYVNVLTSEGIKHLKYTSADVDSALSDNQNYVHHGLGTNIKNNQWQTVQRDLQADLNEYYPTNINIISVNGFSVIGSGLLSEIKVFGNDINNATIYGAL